ncbi:MAG: EAL domain-containing protein [Nitrosomonadales bacterium]|nr:EAL domain-containing protein [Nitrosomonadales bacterium]
MIDTRFISTNLAENFSNVIEAISDAFVLKDAEGRWLITNEASRCLFGLHDLNWYGKTDKELIAECPGILTHYEELQKHELAVWNKGTSLVTFVNTTDWAGIARVYELRMTPLFNIKGEHLFLVVIAKDVTEKRLAEQNLRIFDVGLETLEAILITDSNNRIVRVNNSFTRLTGYTQEEVIGKTPAILKSGRHDKEFYQAMWNSLLKDKLWEGEIWDKRKDGQLYPKWITIRAVNDPDGDIHHYVGIFTDLSEHKEARKALQRLAFYDPLTDLPNRRLFRDQLNLAIENANHNFHYGAVLMVDVDNFKLINDTKGHAVGDSLLIEISRRLKSEVRPGDLIARLGGDEFVIMLELLSTNEEKAALQADMVSQKILSGINKPFLIEEYEIHTSLSIGISMFEIPSITSAEILKRADVAMYLAKSAGRNTMRFFDHDSHAILEKRISLESKLRVALVEKQLKLYFQPQFDHQYQILGAEVLLRWNHPVDGLIMPSEFIPLAEDSGLIVSIGDWVIHSACMQLKQWEDHPLKRDLTLAVNLSAKQFSQSDFIEKVCIALKDTGANPAMLKLELTETLVLKNVKDAIEKMNTLRRLGIQFSIDDFGTGYSSLSYLHQLPIRFLKIDRSFVREINTNKNNAIIVQTIIGMAQNLGFDVVAEGVETEDQLVTLKRFGCHVYQGYLLSKPVPLDVFESQLNQIIKGDP